jgi:uncharacterized protein (DUF1800 family)
MTGKDDEPASPWVPYKPSDAEPWNRQRVVHLHRRAGFAATWDQIERDLADGPRQAIDRLLQGGRVSFSTRRPDQSSNIPVEKETRPHSASGETAPRDFEAMARTIGDAAVASGNPNRLKAWWLYRMLFSPDPLGERLTLLWHNHFATSNRKVQDLALMREQNELFRQHARSNFGDLLRAVVKHPAMLVWLDADANRKGHPNENLAREMLELFTLGIGHYTEADVQAAARALTGWAVVDGRFGFRQARHDADEKLILGRSGSLNGDELLELLLEHPATAQRLANRICGLFFGESTLDEKARQSLAEGLRENDLNIGWAVETVLRSQSFFADANLRSRVAGPVEWSVGTVRALECADPPPSTLLLAEWTTRMGQDLFYPPNVGGWNEGRAWLGSHGVLARANFAAALVDGRVWHPSQPRDLWQLVHRHHETDGVTEAVTWLAELLWGAAPAEVVSEIVAAANQEKPDRQLSAAVALLLARPESQLI